MLEMMLGGKPGSSLGGDTGPGPATMIGSYSRAPDQLAGYYGTLSITDLGLTDAAQFYSLTGTGSLGLNIVNPNLWYKFHIDGKTLFTPSRPCRANIAWQTLYARGMVSGTDDNGVIPSGVAAVKQDKKITIGNYIYRVRLWHGAPANPTRLGSTSGGYDANDPTVLYGSEWNRLLYNIVSTTGLAGQEGDKWASITPSSMGVNYSYGKSVICVECNSGDSRWVFIRSGSTAISNTSATIATLTSNDQGWWPVLELYAKI